MTAAPVTRVSAVPAPTAAARGLGVWAPGWIVAMLGAGCVAPPPRPAASTEAAAPQRPAPTDAASLARAKNCFACHAVSQRAAGPAFSVVARAREGNPNALALLEQRIRFGSINAWGPTPMPAMASVSREEGRVLAQWLLTMSGAPLPPPTAASAAAVAPAVVASSASAPPSGVTATARPVVRDPVFDQLALAGVRPGMTRQQAVAALKADNPKRLIFDAYTATGMGGTLWTGAHVKPDFSGFFSRLVAVASADPVFARVGGHDRNDESYKNSAYFGVASCYDWTGGTRAWKESAVIVVDFTPSLTDPRVAQVRESRSFCRGKAPPERELIAEIRRKYPMAISSTYGLNDQGDRIAPDPSTSRYYAFIEWRAGGPTLRSLDARIGPGDLETPVDIASMARVGGGLVLHAEIGLGFPRDIEYTTTLLWSEDAMADRNKMGLLLQRMEQAGVRVGDVNDPKKRERVDLRGIERPAR